MQTIKGFRDILPRQISLWQNIERQASNLFEAFGFEEIRTPVLEKTRLFARSIGESTDIVEKEMYSFPGSKGDRFTLRPEATASIARAYIQDKMYARDPVRKLYTIGPMFRKERPQKGRYRQFYQIDVEVFGVASAYIDTELVYLLNELFVRLGLRDLKTCINSLGCRDCRPYFQKAFLDFLSSEKNALCPDCGRRMEKNPLRILDCKVPDCKKVLRDAPATFDYLCDECDDHFNTVKTALSRQNVDFIIDKSLVRGLDYYMRTAWEIHTSALGAQSAVAGGGRYDGLIKELGGPQVPGIGFAVGFDRLVEIMEQFNAGPEKRKIDVFIIPLGDKAVEKGYLWSCELNRSGFRSETDFRGKSMKSLMKRADKLNARYVLIAGENEFRENRLILRNMNTREQVSIAVDSLLPELTEILKK